MYDAAAGVSAFVDELLYNRLYSLMWEQGTRWNDARRYNRLATLHPQDAEAAGYWAKYVTTWTAWNHVRTIAALAAAALLTVALSV